MNTKLREGIYILLRMGRAEGVRLFILFSTDIFKNYALIIGCNWTTQCSICYYQRD